jgi:hypothetical protein
MPFIFSQQLEYIRDLEKHIEMMEIEDLLLEIMGEKPTYKRTIEKCKDRLWELQLSLCP